MSFLPVDKINPGDLSDETMLSSLDAGDVAALLMSTVTVRDVREIMEWNLELCKTSTKATHIRWFSDLLAMIMRVNEQQLQIEEKETAEDVIRRIVANQVFAAGYRELVAGELKGYVDGG